MLPFAGLMLIIIACTFLAPGRFLTEDNIVNVLRRSSVNAIIGLGATAIIISGGIDLSVGSLLALSGMIGAWTMLKLGGSDLSGSSALVGTLAGVVAGTLGGLLNGVLTTRLNLPPFIVTLGTMSCFRGIALVMNDGQPCNVPTYAFLGTGEVAGIPVSVLMAAVLIVAAVLMLRYTPLGRYAYAIGSNREAAFHAGVAVKGHLTALYTLGGMMVGIASMIATSRTVSAQPTAGAGLELDIVAAVVIGGASLSGGRGTILGTVIGTLLIAFLRNGCTLVGISPNVQLIVIGAIIIAAVALDQVGRSRAK